MEKSSALESFLQSCETGEVESTGEFSIDVEKALEKLSAYQLPFEFAWALKLVQAAVASEAEGLFIKQTSTDTHFNFPLPWSLDEMEEAFHKPPGQDKALSHLMTGLWAASLNDGRPFLLRNSESESLMWTGQELFRVPREKGPQGLTISHRKRSQGRAIPIIGRMEASKTNASILKVLCERACFCPIPIAIDERILQPTDNPVRSPLHYHHLGFGWTANEEARFNLCKESWQWTGFALPNYEISSFWWLSIRFGVRKYDTNLQALGVTGWKFGPRRERSHLHWLIDGVVVREEPVRVAGSWASLVIALSADGLRTDLTGFNLVDSDESERRKLSACENAAQAIQEIEDMRFDGVIGEFIPGSNIWGGIASFAAGVIGGAVVGTLMPSTLPILTIGGGATALSIFAKKNEEMQAKPFLAMARRQFEVFKDEWYNRFARSVESD